MTLFDPQPAQAEVTKPDPKLAAYRRRFLAAGGCLLIEDDPDGYLAQHMRAGRDPRSVASLSRNIQSHNFDEFCRRLLAKGSIDPLTPTPPAPAKDEG